MCVCVIVCQGPHACTDPNPGRRLHHFPALPVWMDITLPSIKPSPSHTLPVIVLSLSLFPFVIIRWQKRCRLSASHWLLDIESGKGRGVPFSSSMYIPSFFLPGGPTVALSAMVAVHPCQHLRCILSCPSLCR